MTALASAPGAAGRFSLDGERVLLAIAVFYVGAFCLIPLARLFAEAVLPGGAVDLDLMRRVLGSRAAVAATWNTVEAGLASTVLSVVLGTLFALVVGLTDVRLKPVLVFLLLMPMLIPAQITALAWLELVGPSSVVLKPLGYAPVPGARNPLYSREGVVLLMGIEHSTMVFLAVRAGLRGLPRNLVEAARAAGAGPLEITATIVLPLLVPSLVAGAALAFVSSIGNFGIPALLGIPGRYTLLTTLIYQRLTGFGPSVLGEVAALAFVLAAMAAVGLIVQALALRGRDVQVEGTVGAEAPFRLGRWRAAVEAPTWLLLLAIAVLPLIALAATSVLAALGVPLTVETVTFSHYRYALFEHQGTQRAFVNSFLLAGTAAVAVVAVSLPLGYLVICRKSPTARLLDMLADAPYALPGIVLSIACIMVYLKPLPVIGIGLYSTFWIILVAYLGRFLALGLRPTISGMQQMDRTLEEAAQIAGAGSARRLVNVVLPIAAPAAAAGGLLVFMSAFNELTVSVLLWSTGNETLGVIVFSLYDEGNATAAAAVSMLAVLATLAIALVTTLLSRRLPHGVLPWQA